jgi:hypothetical protein
MIVAPLTALILGSTVVAGAEEPTAAAATPAAATSPAPTATPAASTAAPQAASAAASATAPADAAAALAAARDKRLRDRGYKPEKRHGETIYCRSEMVVGTRFPSKVCGTGDQLDQITTDDKDALQTLQRRQITPMGH